MIELYQTRHALITEKKILRGEYKKLKSVVKNDLLSYFFPENPIIQFQLLYDHENNGYKILEDLRKHVKDPNKPFLIISNDNIRLGVKEGSYFNLSCWYKLSKFSSNILNAIHEKKEEIFVSNDSQDIKHIQEMKDTLKNIVFSPPSNFFIKEINFKAYFSDCSPFLFILIEYVKYWIKKRQVFF